MIRHLGGYSAGIVLTFIVGVVSVPLVIAVSGASVWAQVAVLQSISALAAVLVSFGWGATGASMIAVADPSDRASLFMQSVKARVALFIVAAPIAVLVGLSLTSLPLAAVIFGCLGYLVPALGGVWYFVGESRPGRVFLLDAVPRAAGVILGMAALWISRSIVLYTAALFTLAVASVLVTYFIVLGHRSIPRELRPFRGVWATLLSQRHGVATTASAAVYANSPLLIASVFIPGQIEVLAMAFRIYGYVNAAFAPALQVAQGWIPSAGPSLVPHRARRSARLAGIVGGLVAIPVAVFMPTAGSLLSGGAVNVPFQLSIPFGICAGAILVSQIVGLACLTALKAERLLALSTMTGAVVGIGLLVIGAMWVGATGIAVGLAFTEVLVTVYQVVALRRLLRATPATATPSGSRG